MSKPKKKRCPSVFLGRWTGEEYRCALREGHAGLHSEAEVGLGVGWKTEEEWRRVGPSDPQA